MKNSKKYMALFLAGVVCLQGCGSEKSLVDLSYKASDYVTLGEYTGLEVEQVEEKTALTDEEKQYADEEILNEYAEEKEITDRGAENGDYVSITYTLTEDGEVVDEATEDDPVEFQLGNYEYFSEDQEEALLGAKAGEKKTVEFEEDSISYVYDIVVRKVYSLELPEFNDDFAKEQGYDSADAMKEAVYAEQLASTNEEYASNAEDELLTLVTDGATVEGYPQELYDSMLESLNEAYETYFGTTMEEMFEGDEESIESTVVDSVNQELIVEAIAEKEDIGVSQEELDEYKTELVSSMGYESTEALEADYDDQSLITNKLHEKVMEFLLSKANVTYISEEEYYASEDEDYLLDDDSYEEDEEADGEDAEEEVSLTEEQAVAEDEE